MKTKTGQSHIGTLSVLQLSGLFAVCILLVLLTGANSYRALARRDAAAWEQRICTQYVAAKIRHADAAECVYVGAFDGTPDADGDTLFLSETVDGEAYLTRIYWYDGAVRELYADAEAALAPADGDEVLTAQGLRFHQQGRRITILATDQNGAESSVNVCLRSGKGSGA